MREIKFRGKTEKGEWVTGYYLVNPFGEHTIAGERRADKVLPETVGQYTGLKANGNEIYEGDIVNEFRKSRSYPEGRNIKRVIAWHDDMTLDDSYGETAVGFNMFGGELEVIGNIYENPELLGAK